MHKHPHPHHQGHHIHHPHHKAQHVKWSDSYSMGIKLIDDQHKGLLEFVNELFNHASGNEAEERVFFKTVIGQAVDYIKVHFATEEKYMLATKFPGYAEHKKTHEEFVLTVVQSVKDFESGKRLVLTNFAKFLKDWVLSHVAVMDVKYSHYFKKIATRKDNGKLSITAEDIANNISGTI
ncbi:MAG: bacteriohemerythrin [Treponema sp.]|jgi:hemerythrin|nr:bacteriohemerythrin [Treponema sp.]